MSKLLRVRLALYTRTAKDFDLDCRKDLLVESVYMASPGSRRSKSYDENIFTMGIQERTILKSQIQPTLGCSNRRFPCTSFIGVKIGQVRSIQTYKVHKMNLMACIWAKWPIKVSNDLSWPFKTDVSKCFFLISFSADTNMLRKRMLNTVRSIFR